MCTSSKANNMVLAVKIELQHGHGEIFLTQKLACVPTMVIELMVLEISLKNGVSLSQSNLREINCISCSACENEMHTDLCFEV
mgnify:CR=1 FL=1